MATNAVNIVIDDMDATQLLTSSPLQMSTGSPVRRISSLSSLTNISNVDIDLTQSSPEERASFEEKRGRFQTSPNHRRSTSVSGSRSWPRDFSNQNSSGVANSLSENVDLANSNDLKDPDSLPILQEEPLRFCDRAAQIMAFDTDSLGDKICKKVPQICPGKAATYLVDLSKLRHPDDIGKDIYGSWGHMCSENYYYAIDKPSKSVRKLNFGRSKKLEEDAKPDMKIRRRFQKHPKTNGQFKKSIFIAFFGENVNVPKWAIVAYEWLCPPFDFLNKAHGNSKDQTKPFQPTAKSVINRMREKARYLTPQQNVHSMAEEVGTVVQTSPAFVPRGKKQARDIAATIPDRKKGKGGSSVRTDYDHVSRMVFEPNSFVMAFKPGDSLGSVRALLGSKQNFHLFRKAVLEGGCIIFIDMTYNPCEKGYLTIISVRHPLLIDAETGRNVLRPVAFYLSTERTTEDYNCMAEEIKSILKASDTDFVKGWVSDGELALINGFQRCTLFAPDKSSHLLCELHLKKPIDEKLKALGFSTEDRRDICDDIFGKETFDSTSGHRERKLGLIDCRTKTEYLQQLQVTKTLWDTLQKERQSQVLFSEWYDRKQKDKIWNGSGYPMRKKAGLGDPPGKVTNNDSEVMNRHIKDLVSPDGHKLPWHVFIQKLKQVSRSLFDELVSAITGTGQYRIRPDVCPDFQVSTQQWHSMTWRQKMCRLEPLFLLELPQGGISSQNVHENASIPKASEEIVGISAEKWGEMCKKAAAFTHEQLVNQNRMNKTFFGIFDGLETISVNQTDEYTFICGNPARPNSSCKTYRDLGAKVCQHTLAVADFLEIRPAYEDFIKVSKASMTTTDLIEPHVSAISGSKPKTNKRHIGGGPSKKTHSTVVVRTTPGTPAQLLAAAQVQTRSAPPKLSNGSKDKPTPAQRAKLFERKEIVCTEPWHNRNKFELMFTEDWFNTLSKARFCWSCKNYIDKAAPPDDMVVVHMERFWIPPPQSKWSAVGHMQNRITHARHSCVIAKYPYFTPDLLEATIQVKDKLSPEHERYLADHLGVDFLNH